MTEINRLELTNSAEKDLKKAPSHIKAKFKVWVAEVESKGVRETRKRSGWHDEPLQGDRVGQRSIRLNKQWRAFYIEETGEILAIVIEINPHNY